eukprot:CAMPEP_0170086710 /NCGR_PEP_ID=MMETSP0019_2-20121128/21327_1 /TAXON_ID=98059 /ORGANISM="Dinobryon sp., Strain UTEXLB2267" /LENGTH=111 /DNA_ID=CAMNT_0010303911 /DNA_START=718 /DNA_END=1053 /DNA_ORIENTATION=+
MLLKRGDFIEDKFGQVQRDLLAAAGKAGNDDLAVELFRWYGSYLCWWTPPEDSLEEEEEDDGNVEYENLVIEDEKIPERGISGATAMVSHLKGRQYHPDKIAKMVSRIKDI